MSKSHLAKTGFVNQSIAFEEVFFVGPLRRGKGEIGLSS